MLQINTDKLVSTKVDFKLLNSTHNAQGYYFTMEIPTAEPVNEIILDFKQDNFDWMISLEGSQNQQEWFSIVDNYRILSINNPQTKYKFTKVTFADTKYRFFRLLIKSKEKPDLSMAKIRLQEVSAGSFNIHSIEKIESHEDKKRKLSTVEISLKEAVPVSSIKIDIKNGFDYYRPITISYLADSIKTEKGWKYKYQSLTSGTLNSFDQNEFNFKNTILQKLKISINNNDNEPLTIDTLTVKGNTHELVARFTEPATYFLTYGNKQAVIPNYDINLFASKVPNKLNELNLGQEQLIDKEAVPLNEPFFINKNWLWALMLVLITVLGYFSLNMIKTKK